MKLSQSDPGVKVGVGRGLMVCSSGPRCAEGLQTMRKGNDDNECVQATSIRGIRCSKNQLVCTRQASLVSKLLRLLSVAF